MKMTVMQTQRRCFSAIFLDGENMRIVQQQIEQEEAQRQERSRSRTPSSVRSGRISSPSQVKRFSTLFFV